MLTKLNRGILLMLVLVFSLTLVIAQPTDANPDSSNDLDNEGEVLLPEPYCGDGIVNTDEEECDGADLDGMTCSDVDPFNFGDLSCSSECTFVYSQCIYDFAAPEVKLFLDGNYVACTDGSCDYYVNQDTEITLDCADTMLNNSGHVRLSWIYYQKGTPLPGWNNIQTSTDDVSHTYNYNDDLTYELNWFCRDGAMNFAGTESDPFRQIHIRDSKGPVIDLGFVTPNVTQFNGTYFVRSDTVFNISAFDEGVGGAKLSCDISGNGPFAVNDTFLFSFGGLGINENGLYDIECSANDALSNVAKMTYSIQLQNPESTSSSSGSDDDEEREERRSGGGGCLEVWTCEEWSTCTDGLQVRECTQKYPCGTTFSRPALVQECETPLVIEEQNVEQPGALARITGAVIGPNGRPTGLGILIFFVLIVGAYFVVGTARKKMLAKSAAAKPAKSNGKKAPKKK